MRPKVFVNRRISQPGLDILEKRWGVKVNPHDRVLNKEELGEGAKKIEGLLCLLIDTIATMAANNLVADLNGKVPPNLVNKEVLEK